MSWSATTANLSGFCRRNRGTAVRAVVCALLFWSFLAGKVLLPLHPAVVLAFATLLGGFVALELLLREASQAWILGGILAIDAVVGSSYLVWRQIQPPVPTGALIAASDPTPPGCGDDTPQGDDLLMAFGTDRALGKGPGPFAPILVDDCVALRLLRKGGGLMIQAFGYQYTEDIAFHVMDNVYEADTALKMRALRPDRSTFVLLDRFDKEVLYVRYLNPHAVRIRGRFLCGEAPQAVIRDDAIFVGGVRLNGVFVGQHPANGHRCATIKAGTPGIAISKR